MHPRTATRRKKPQGKPVRGYGRDPRFDGVGLKRDRNGFYVHTRRARSDSYPTVGDIPASDVEYIRSTGSWHAAHPESAHRKAAAYHAGAYGFGRGGTRCADCGRELARPGNPAGEVRSKVLPFLCLGCAARDSPEPHDTGVPGYMTGQQAHETVEGLEGRSRPYGKGDFLRQSQSRRGRRTAAGYGKSGSRCAECGREYGTRDADQQGDHHLVEPSMMLPHLCDDCAGRHVQGDDVALSPHPADPYEPRYPGRYRPFGGPDALRTSQSALAGTASWQERSDYCTQCGSPMMDPGDLGPGDDQFRPRSSRVRHLCADCASPRDAYQRRGPEEVRRGRILSTRPWSGGDSLPPSQSSLSKAAYGETRVPPQVDTLRMDECPVCGEHNVWSGSRCPVCGFVMPPSVFRDPDTGRAAQVREQLDGTGEVDLPPGDPGAAQAGGALPPAAQAGSGQDADAQLVHPDQIAPDGVPVVQGEEGAVPGGEEGPVTDGVPPGEEQEGGLPPDGEEPPVAEDLICPACGTTFEEDAAAQPGVPCPACGMAALHPAGEDPAASGEAPADEEEGDGDGDPQKGQEGPSEPDEEDGDEEDEDEDMPGSKTAAALAQAQARKIAELSAQNAVLSAQLRFLASAAGVDREVAEVGRRAMRRRADVLNPASPVPDPPEGAPTQTTEQALMPEAMDDPSRPGTTPGANSRVPAELTTTSITPGVEIQTPPATNLIDVTAPVQGTNPSQDGGVPISQRRIETDVRIDPDPLKAHGPGIGGLGDNGAAFPWVAAARTGQGTRSAALHGGSPLGAPGEADASRRTYASIRLARLRVQAGLAQGEELGVAERIERDASLPTPVIEHEIATLSALPQAQQRLAGRPARHTASRSVPSLASVGATAAYAPAVADDLDASDLFD